MKRQGSHPPCCLHFFGGHCELMQQVSIIVRKEGTALGKVGASGGGVWNSIVSYNWSSLKLGLTYQV
jgi:hypothetical protein